MSKELEKMNIISIVQKLKADDVIILQKYIENLEKENKKYKEVIDKAKEWVERKINSCTIEANSTTTDTMCRITIVGLTNLLDILKEVD